MTRVKQMTTYMLADRDGDLWPKYYSDTAAKLKNIADCSLVEPWPALYRQGYRCIRVTITPMKGKTKGKK